MIKRFKLWGPPFVILGLLILAGIRGLSHKKPEAPANPKRVRAALALLKSMPDWTKLEPAKKSGSDKHVIQKRAKIIRSLHELSRFTLAELRATEVQYCNWLEKGGTDFAEGRTFLLNRFLFDVPPRYLMDGKGLDPLRGFNAAGKNPEIGSWPFSKDRKGRLHLKGWYAGNAYMGSACPSITEFDYFARHYPLRELR